MIKQMTPRERTLATIVGLAFFVVVNFALVKVLGRYYRQSQADLTTKTIQIETLKTLLAERDTWNERDQWLQAKMPKLENRDSAAVELRKVISEIAGKHNVTLDKVTLNSPETRPQYSLVALGFETKSRWQDLVAFLRELQAPERFIVVERLTLKIDEADKTQMRGAFRSAKWFAAR